MAHPILAHYDALLVDLDGTVFEGSHPIDGAAEGLAHHDVIYVTNNASRSPEQVAEHLTSIGFATSADQVLTSAMAACDMARAELGLADQDPSSHGEVKAYVIGNDSFKELARRAGFSIVDSADDEPAVVLQGHSPDNDWKRLSEGALAIRRGARYIASNLDTTLPSERGLLVGNGSMVAAVTSATGVRPSSAGKPGPAMFHVAADKLGSTKPLVVGDRLDTDIAGGNAAGFDTLCTVTGVSSHWDVLTCAPEHRPTFIAANMRDHLTGWSASAEGTTVQVRSGEHGPTAVMVAEALAVVAPVVWELIDHGGVDAQSLNDLTINGADEAAQAAVEGWRK